MFGLGRTFWTLPNRTEPNVRSNTSKQVGTPTKARAGFKKGYPKYGRPQWAFEN